ncbi:hypothetical protein AVEN_136854-1 [Araneus ventricosus]|uniref:Uncharacterized protein n=1 Tax=Araneus ventricosus TaxID=182803 RepID=A0A4Y2G0B0_ARAVE|nr:hypothetical protein AVEN_136854-1 [Araneus ventricosus]
MSSVLRSRDSKITQGFEKYRCTSRELFLRLEPRSTEGKEVNFPKVIVDQRSQGRTDFRLQLRAADKFESLTVLEPDSPKTNRTFYSN